LDTNTTNGSGPRAGRREWIGLAVLALPILLLSLDLSVLYLALPHLSADLGASSTQQLWIVDIYGFMIAGLLVTMGTLGDRIGRRKLLLIGASAFGGPSVAAAFSTSAEMLIATRALLGIAEATLMPSTLALISNMFTDPGQRATAIGVWASCFAAGAAIGPIIGGVLLVFLWWGSVFLLGVPVMLLLVTAPLLLPEYRDTHAGRLDLTSVALSPWPPSCRSSTASRNWLRTASRRCPSWPWWPVRPSGLCSCYGSAG
jgi:MFS transporter, DHA2 family, multidrug resistance protein